MSEATTNIVITARDSTAGAFASVNSNITGLASSAARLSTSLAAVGAGAVVGSLAAFTRKTIDAQDELFKLSQKTGIAVESLAGLEFASEQAGVELDKVAKATRAFSLLVAEAADKSSGAAKKLGQLGLSYKDLKDLSPEKQLLALADALSKFSREDRAVALTATLGNRMADLVPLLAGGSAELQKLIEQGKKFNPVTEESARQAERFNDQINLLSKSVSALGREMVQGFIPSLTRVSDEMVKASQQGGILAGVFAGVKQLFVESFGNPKILGDVGQIRREILLTQETIKSMELKKDSILFDKNALEHEHEKLAQLEIDLQNAIVKSRETVKANDDAANSAKKFAIAVSEVSNNATKTAPKIDRLTRAMSDQSRIESEYVKLLVIERKAREDLIRPYQQSAKAAQDRLVDMRNEVAALELSKKNQISLEQAIEQTTIARLEEKRVIAKDAGAIAAINEEIAARREMIGIIQSREAQQNGDKIRQSELQAYDQFAIQAARNIQTNLAAGIEIGFRDGFKSGVRGLLDGILSTVSSVVSQVVSIRLLNAVGAGSLLGLSGSAAASTGGGISALNALSLGSNAVSLFKGGFGATSLIGGGLSMFGGNVGAFGAGLAGDALGGLAAGGFTSGAASAASLGASVGAFAGPAVALFAVDAIGRMLAGDKKLGGAEMIPVIGGFLAAMFGRGPYKFRQQSLQGTATAEGFSGTITDVYRSKGGLFMSNKHKSFTNPLTAEMDALFDETISGFANSARDFAKNLGLSTQFIDTYNKDFQIKSEKKEKLTEEAIASLLDGIGNEFAVGVLPIVDTLKKAGEDSFDALSRLNTEYLSLVDAATLALGKNLDDARAYISSVSFEDRTGFIDAAGGIDQLNQKVAFFAETFLTEQERLAPIQSKVNEQLKELGINTDITREQFKALVQSFGQVNGVSKETFLALLNLAPAFSAVVDAANNFKDGYQTTGTRSDYDPFVASFERAEGKLITAIQNANSRYESVVTPLKNLRTSIASLIDSLKSLRESIDLGQQSGLSPTGKLLASRNALLSANTENISGRVTGFLDIAKSQAGTRLDYLRDVAFSKTIIDQLSADQARQLDRANKDISAAAKYRKLEIQNAIINSGFLTSGINAGFLMSSGFSGGYKPPSEIADNSNAIMAALLSMNAELSKSTKAQADMYRLWLGMTNGTALNTVAA